MKISMTLGTDVELDHEMLMTFAPTLLALNLLQKTGDKEQDEEDAEALTHDVSRVFDRCAVELNGKTFRPKICWVDESGQILSGAEDYVDLQDGAYGSLEDLHEVKIDPGYKAP
ncbi:hypothetical protein [Litoreibacter albidus]|uniref:Uncharacterized protein n=1 Tax=Litoreibacter albidus TaxID=670155 RepID=A0A1H3B901_9RHOB|nr:hypothetical protein [Litoreibacter albidus]SDX38148.1 hypothetical protein SAMN04488001_3088 [Litoreibacter albidus]